ncbi:MAG: cysteine desulfurase [Chitinophagaceae bacterium]|nr:cysteine desulfurase [Chitinophagaceae bacterium]
MGLIYFDNAATTSLHPEVLQAMLPYFENKFGNPSAIHSFGRETRIAIENARKQVSNLLGAHTSEIFFTSCGTESTNTIFNSAINDLKCERIISTAIEHHATLYNCIKSEKANVELINVNLNEEGFVDYNHLEELLSSSSKKTLVSLMHANNEVGNLLDIEKVGDLCEKYNAYFHSDMVQTIGHLPIDFSKNKVHFASASAHKFHGPKGSGLLFKRNDIELKPFILGGGQERNMRAGTENVAGIVGFSTALKIAIDNMNEDSNYIKSLRNELATKLKLHFQDVTFLTSVNESTLFTVLNIGFPLNNKTEMLLMNLDINGIAVSGGSACTSGSQGASHVLKAIYPNKNFVPIRFSFSKLNTQNEIEKTIEVLKKILNN